MSNLQERNRVLSRAGARVLSDKEVRQVTGGFVVGGGGTLTGACVYDPVLCQVISGDCNNIPPACLGQ